MSYLLAQILVCLLIAGLIGAVIGWLLRGGCSRKLRDCEDEWKMKMGSLESEWNSKLTRTTNEEEVTQKEIQAATLKRHAQHVESETPSYSYEQELKEKLELAQKEQERQTESTSASLTAATASVTGIAANMMNHDEKDTPNEEQILNLTTEATQDQTKEVSDYQKELREKLQISTQEEKPFDIEKVQHLLASRNITLSPEKIALYAANGIDFEKGEHLEDSYDIQAIEGIGPKYAEAFHEMGISNTQELVTKLNKYHDKLDQVAKALQIQPETLSSWISMADLIQLPGVDGQAAELMQTVGIASAKELAITNANSLHSEMVAFNKKSPIVPEVPSAERLTFWSKIAKLLGV